MAWLSSEARRGLRSGTVGLATAAVALTITSDGADARRHHRLHVTYVHVSHAGRSHHAEARSHRHSHSEDYSPPGSSIVVDANSGAVLEGSNPDALRHPASLTKVMTLYLLFERLDAGKMRLDTPLKVSEHAADQDPTKLNLKPGSTISVEDAIKGIVTRSANDAAVTIAENIGGDEDGFARMMTAKARALGMTRTVYRNASGLPDDEQNTTARDQALLGRAIQDRFPRYYKFFSTESFVFHGEAIHGHNHLLGSVDGVDGIKTGFTRASGFNLLILGASRRPLPGRRGDGRPLLVRARRAYARPDLLAYQGSFAAPHRADDRELRRDPAGRLRQGADGVRADGFGAGLGADRTCRRSDTDRDSERQCARRRGGGHQ